jgi:putative ABC transport system substrate-binding protein
MTTRRRFAIAGASLLAFPTLLGAQRRLWRIGYHSAGSAQSNAGWLDAFRAGMSELGWSEARHYVVDARYADGREEVLARLARELVATEPDVLLTTAGMSIQLLSELTKTIPIVFTIATDPVAEGFAVSLQRPGGNLTGLTTLTRDLAAKRLQLIRDAFPDISHLVLLFQSNDANSAMPAKDYEAAAAKLKIRLTRIDVQRPRILSPP